MITPSTLAIILQGAPFPGAVFTVTPGGAALDLTIDGATITFCEGAWFAAERRTTPAHLSFTATPTAAQVHAEIRRVLAIVNTPAEPSPTWAEIKADCAGPDLPADDPLYDRAAAAQALAKVTAERDHLLIAESTLSKIAAALAIPALAPHDDALSMVKRLTDAHAVVSQRLIGSQKEVAEVSAERDAAAARAEKVEHRLRRDDELREQIAAAVGLDGSASLALILDTVTRDRPDDPRGVKDLRALVNYHQTPITFNARPLTLAERAGFVIRRLWQGRTNATAEAAALRRDLGDISDALGDLPDTAEREPIGDREEHLGLSTAERIRLSR